jgi:hypothetical protein
MPQLARARAELAEPVATEVLPVMALALTEEAEAPPAVEFIITATSI